ncbi:MAG TPA: GAF domain-containing protein, partial [Gammaproteobacteria bacterium]|nr:GAF domain-containing protein [Gammaproteobacteria bacterium]
MTDSRISEWLQTQSGLLQHVLAGVVKLSSTQSETPELVGYPEQTPALDTLNSAAELAIQQGKPVIKAPRPDIAQPHATLTIAYPVSLQNNISGAVAFLLKGNTPQQGQKAIAILRQGLPWLGKLLNGDCSESASLQDRLGKLTRLVATGLAAEQFNAVATTLTTELATELDCDRVFLGMMRSRKIRLEGISQTSELARREAFAQAVTASMDEACDQQSSISAPAAGDATGNLNLSIRHDDLLKRYHLGAVCTIPLMLDQEVIGALLFERGGDK